MIKGKVALFAVCALFVIVTGSSHAQVLWRSAKTMKKGSIITMGMMYYMDFSKKYDSVTEEWKDNPNDQSNKGFQLMFGYGVTDRLETSIHVPITFKSINTPTIDETTSGIGDIYLKTRYSILSWAKDKHGLTVVGSLRFATGKDDETVGFCNCGDGTTDVGLGGIFSTKWKHKFRGHVKLNYWLNGKNDADTNIGDEIKLILKLDRNLTPKIMPFVTYIYYTIMLNLF